MENFLKPNRFQNFLLLNLIDYINLKNAPMFLQPKNFN